MAEGVELPSRPSPPLNQAVGYGVILGLGFLFAFGMMMTTYVLRRYNNEVQTSEVFSTAGRSIKSGLVASAVVSSWTWAATLLQSTAVTYRYGLSGSFFYASGATVQIILFATVAIELKRRAPNAHTFLEAVRARYGGITHGVYIAFGLFTNFLVTAMLLAGGSAVTESLTGVPTAAACFLIPIGVVLYTMFGGIKATFITDYVHTVIVLIIILVFSLTVYSTNPILGSPAAVWDALNAVAERHPVAGNAGGSYLTMRSEQGGIFFVINIIGYYNKAIAAHPVHALPGYIIGGLSWFAVPFLCATTMGLAALALENTAGFPTFPERISPADVSAGLVLPDTAVALLGTGGAAAALVMVFMAVTSAFSAQLIAVSSISTYDVYETYIHPRATGKRLIWIGHMTCIVWAVVMAAVSTGFYYGGVSLGYLYLFMGVIISGAVLPATLTLLWDGQSWSAATFSPIIALACSVTGWLVQAKVQYNEITVESTGSNYPMLVGNVVALLAPAIFVPILSFAFKTPNYDWKSMLAIRRGGDDDLVINHQATTSEAEIEQAQLMRAARLSRGLVVFLTLALLILWPMPMFGSSYIFSKRFFIGWVVVGLIWCFASFLAVGIYPAWEGRGTSIRTFKAIYKDVTGHGKVVVQGRSRLDEEAETSCDRREGEKGR